MGQEEASMLQRTQVLAGCTDGPCPRVDATTEPGLMAVQGTKPGKVAQPGWIEVPGAIPSAGILAAMESVPEHETVVLVRQEELDEYARTGHPRPPRGGEGIVFVPPG